mgnify:CR=1 FL=1
MFIKEIKYMDISDINPSNFNNKNFYCEINIIKKIYSNLEKINYNETVKKEKHRYFFINLQKKKLVLKEKEKEQKILNKLKLQGKKAEIKKFDTPIYISQHSMKQKKTDKIRHYRAIAAGRKIIKDFEDDNIDELIEETNKQIYKSKWSRLAKSLKFNRLYKYVESLRIEYNLTKENAENLKKDLFDAVKKRIITKSGHVEYDEDNCKILSIGCLEYNENKNLFTLKV